MSPWQRIARLYQTIAVVFLNTVILLVLALLVTNAFLNQPLTGAEKAALTAPEAGSIGIHYRYSDTMRLDAHYFSPPQAVQRLAYEFDLFASQGHWQVHPWAGLTMRPFDGQYLNIDRDGYRVTPPPDPAYRDKLPFVVWAFGGSTTFGQSLPDDFTLSAQLQVVLQERLPDYQVQVRNFGVPWYFSSQEVTLFAEQLRRETPAQVAIFLDGLNELYAISNHNHTPLIARLAGAWEAQIAEYTHPQDQPWVTFNYSFPPNRLASQLGLVEVNPPRLLSYNFALAENPSIRDGLDYGIQQYIRNQHLAQVMGDAFDISTYFFLQPLPFMGDDAMFTGFRDGVNVQNENTDYYDLTGALADADPAYQLLADPTHYSDYAVRLLSEKIADIILK